MSAEKYSSPDVPAKKLYGATIALLCSLFSDVRYSDAEKFFYECICQNGVENFISGEIFTDNAIKLILPKNADADQKLFYHLAAAYLLHCRHNAKLERCEPEKYNVEAPDKFLYDALCYLAWKNYSQWEQRNPDSFRLSNFFDKLLKTSLIFHSPDGIVHVWRGAKYSVNDKNCCQIKLKVIESFLYRNYGDCLKYLMTKAGNSIHDFGTSTRSFWNKFINLSRSKGYNGLEDICTADVDLILFCMSLGLDDEIFKKLIDLRNKTYPNEQPKQPRTPALVDGEANYLQDLLKLSKIRLAATRQKVSEPQDIPRRMLLNVNIHLLKRGLKPIINLDGAEEIAELTAIFPAEKLSAVYTEQFRLRPREL